MSSGPYSGIATGLPGAQMGFEQTTSELVARENETRIFNELKTDFFVGPNGKILPKAFGKGLKKSNMGVIL